MWYDVFSGEPFALKQWIDVSLLYNILAELCTALLATIQLISLTG